MINKLLHFYKSSSCVGLIGFVLLSIFYIPTLYAQSPAALAVPSSVVWRGNFTDSEEGVLFERKSANIISSNSFKGSNSDGNLSTGTYSYTKTGPNTGRVNYTAIYTYENEEEGLETETEVGVVNLTFATPTTGTFTSSGTWTTSDGFSGTFSNGSGSFNIEPQDLSDLIGTWTTPTEDGGIAYITFLDNGSYHHTEDGTADDSGHPGLEIGTYTWNTTTGAISTTPTVDQNGEWGLSHNAPDIRFFVNGNELELMEGGGSILLTRPAISSSAIVGSWVFISEGRPVVVIFLADRTYRHSQVGASVGGGFSGMEKGTYLWNSTTKAFTASPTLDQNGEWGLSHPLAPFTISVSGDQLTIQEGSLSFVGQRANSSTALSKFLSASSIPYDQRSPLDDPEKDGISNTLEYALGLDPTKSDPAGLPKASQAAGTLAFTYKRSRPDVTYSVQTAPSLSNPNAWTTTGVTQGTPDSNGNVTATVPITNGARFMRLRVTLAP